MQEYQNLELSALIDMLSQHTAKYSRLLTEGCSEEEYNSCKEIIQFLQAEIETRKNTANNTSISDPGINFTQE